MVNHIHQSLLLPLQTSSANTFSEPVPIRNQVHALIWPCSFWNDCAAFAVYILVMAGCAGWRTSHHQLSPQELSTTSDHKENVSLTTNSYSASTFKYKKGVKNSEVPSEAECSVCLSNFEEGEYVRQLSDCRHSSHAPCIDMWLYSHSSCPLCRTPIHPPDSENSVSTIDVHQPVPENTELTIDNSMHLEIAMLDFLSKN